MFNRTSLFQYFFILGIISLLTVGCEKDVDLNIVERPNVVVVDAKIEQGEAPIVILSTSLSYFNTVTAQQVINSFIKNAVITINNGSQTHTLKMYQRPIGTTGAGFVYYSNDTASLQTAFVGELNKTYKLNIACPQGNYTATTTIPKNAKTFDSLFWRLPIYAKDSTDFLVTGKFTDPVGLGNYIRYFTKTNSEPFYPGQKSVYDDQIVDGTTYTADLRAGVNRLFQEVDSSYTKDFKYGDTITIKLCNIDKATYTFWNTLEFAYRSTGNPFSTPNIVIGNISNGALGNFSGYSKQTKTVIIKK